MSNKQMGVALLTCTAIVISQCSAGGKLGAQTGFPLDLVEEQGPCQRLPWPPQSHMCLRGFTLSRSCLLQTTDFTPTSYATKKIKKQFKASTFVLG